MNEKYKRNEKFLSDMRREKISRTIREKFIFSRDIISEAYWKNNFGMIPSFFLFVRFSVKEIISLKGPFTCDGRHLESAFKV